MFETFTTGAKRVVSSARAEARVLGHDEVAPGHLLLALIVADEGSGAGVPVLDGLTLAKVREHVRDHVPISSTVVDKPSFSIEVKRILTALDRRDGASSGDGVDVDHVALALLSAADGVVDGAIRAAGTTSTALTAAITSRAGEPSVATASAPLPPRRGQTPPAPVVEALPARGAAAVVEPEPEPEPEPVVEALPARGAAAVVEPEPEPVVAAERATDPLAESRADVAHAAESVPHDVERLLPPLRPPSVQPETSSTAPPPAADSLRELVSTLGRAVAVGAGLGLVVYARTARRSKRRAARAGRHQRIVVR